MVILDATAGNRMMWKNKNPPLTVFMDKELQLRIPPDIFGVWEKLPFRDGVFKCVVFDPPHYAKFGPSSRHSNPKGMSWFGMYGTRKKLIRSIANALKEFKRVTNRLCFKWCDTRVTYYEKTTRRYRTRSENPSLWNILSLFGDWTEISRLVYDSPYGKHGEKTYWITFHSSLSRVNDDET